MASALEEREEQSSKCFICNVKVTSRSSYNIYCTFMPQRDVLLMDVMSKILKKVLNSSQIRSSVLCRRCFTLFDELDQISTRYKKLQSDIIKRFASTCIEYEDDSYSSVAKSEDSIQNNELPLCKKENETKSLKNEDESGEKSSNALNEIVETIISNIQAKETSEIDKGSCLNNLKEDIVSTDEKVIDHIDNTINNLDTAEKSISATMENDIAQCETNSNVDISADYINDSSEVIDVKPDVYSMDNSLYLEELVQDDNEDDDFEWKEEQKFTYHEDNTVEDSSSAIDEKITPSSGSEKSGKGQMKKERKKRGSSRSGERACLPAIHSCGLCGKKWRTVTELKSHIQSHSSLRPYVCEICGQAYKMKKALDVHIGMHNGIHPFTCEYCNKSFTQKVGLQKHIPIHTGYTRFQCDLCGKRFIHQKSFHIHTMTHTGEKHVKCPECGLAVLSQSHLKRHLRVHTGERPYACPICGKRFAEKYNMNAHVHIHDNNSGSGPRRNRNHICQLCGMSYDRKHKLEYHLAATHNKIDNKLAQDQESGMLQPKTEYFQENSQNHQIISVENGTIDHNGSTAMITVSGVKLPISLDGAPIMVATLPQQSQTTNLVPLSIPAGSILSYTPTSSNNNDQPIDETSNACLPQNPVTIQLS